MKTINNLTDAGAARDIPGVIAPPPLLYAGTLVVGSGLGAGLGWPGLGVPSLARFAAAGAMFLTAEPLATGALRRFRAAGTNAPPSRPATALVTGGVYRFTRNPMYLSLALLYASVALAADSLVALKMLAPLLLAVRYGVIAREERYMAAKFDRPYLDYQRSVRRWF